MYWICHFLHLLYIFCIILLRCAFWFDPMYPLRESCIDNYPSASQLCVARVQLQITNNIVTNRSSSFDPLVSNKTKEKRNVNLLWKCFRFFLVTNTFNITADNVLCWWDSPTESEMDKVNLFSMTFWFNPIIVLKLVTCHNSVLAKYEYEYNS